MTSYDALEPVTAEQRVQLIEELRVDRPRLAVAKVAQEPADARQRLRQVRIAGSVGQRQNLTRVRMAEGQRSHGGGRRGGICLCATRQREQGRRDDCGAGREDAPARGLTGRCRTGCGAWRREDAHAGTSLMAESAGHYTRAISGGAPPGEFTLNRAGHICRRARGNPRRDHISTSASGTRRRRKCGRRCCGQKSSRSTRT